MNPTLTDPCARLEANRSLLRIHLVTSQMRTASVECEAGTAWRVPFSMLNHVMDI